MRNQRGITLIALIITIIVMLILVGVTVNIALNGGLFTTAKKAANETQIAAEQETLLSAVIATMTDGKVDFEKLDNNLPKGFTGNKGKYKSEKGNKYRVYKDGEVEYSREPDEPTPIYASLEDNNDGEGTKTLVFTVVENTKEGVINLGELADSYTGEGNSTPWYSYRNNITKADIRDVIKPKESTAYWFYNQGNLTKIYNMENLYTSSVKNMMCMFLGCGQLSEIDVSRFDTSNVTNMFYMFYQCRKVGELEVSEFNTENVTDMLGMFGGCSNLVDLDVRNFDTNNVTRMNQMFSGCTNLTKLELDTFNTKKVTKMEIMFQGCRNLTTTITIDPTNIKDITDANGTIRKGYDKCFEEAATEPGAKITVRCKAEHKEEVEKIVNTKSANSNVVLEVID